MHVLTWVILKIFKNAQGTVNVHVPYHRSSPPMQYKSSKARANWAQTCSYSFKLKDNKYNMIYDVFYMIQQVL